MSIHLTPAAEAVFLEHRRANFIQTDRSFGLLMAIQWVGVILAALILSPRTYDGIASAIHPHVWAAVILGTLLSSFPIALILAIPGQTLTRHIVAVAQMGMSALLIHVTGGRIESHFHIFGSLAFLAFYRDWKVLIPATILTALDHILRGAYFPVSIYGIAAASEWRWLEHAGWVLFTDIFLILSCLRSTQSMKAIAAKQEELDHARTIALQASAAKSEFLANMSHEIRTPLNGVTGMLDLMLAGNLDPQQRQFAKVARTSADNLLNLINDILDFSKIEAGKLELSPIDFELRPMAQGALDIVGPRAAKKGVAVALEIDPALPRCFFGDPDRLQQILLNLLSNAIKFTEKGTIFLRIAALTNASGGPNLAFSVADPGIGIPADRLDRLFKSFSQVDASTTRKYGGTGLGLAISKQLVEIMGGTISVASTPGVGTTFSFTLQLNPSTTPLPVTPEITLASTLSITTNPHHAIHVLVAEDNEINQMVAEHLLTNAGFTCNIVSNGQEAINAATTHWYDVILMDCQMPEKDGFEATQEIRAWENARAHAPIPILALTASAIKGDRERCLAAGMTDYLTKPLDPIQVVQTLRKLGQRKIPRKASA